MTHLKNPIICALDTKDISEAKALSNQLSTHIGAIKLGLEFFTAQGAEGVKALVATGIPVFLDLKFHDIPNTVGEAVRAATRLGAFMMTLHTLGGKDMMLRAAESAKEEADKLGITPPLLVGVTVLTSMNEADLKETGITASLSAQVENLARLANSAGLDGIVCSPHEIKLVKALCGRDFKTIVPGIRPIGSDSGDQKRVTTPAQAIDYGADYLVIGRPITQAQDPAKIAAEIAASIV